MAFATILNRLLLPLRHKVVRTQACQTDNAGKPNKLGRHIDPDEKKTGFTGTGAVQLERLAPSESGGQRTGPQKPLAP
jgi:hypothetical protein